MTLYRKETIDSRGVWHPTQRALPRNPGFAQGYLGETINHLVNGAPQ